MQNLQLSKLFYRMHKVRTASIIRDIPPSVVVQQDGAVKVGHRHGAASLVMVPLYRPRVSAFRPVEREERVKRERDLLA
jgi:hypothetical protein